MENRDLLLVSVLTIMFTFALNTGFYDILTGLLILLTGYSIKSAVYPSDHGKENVLSFILTTLFTVLLAVVVFRFLGKTYLTPIMLLIIIICLPVAFLRRRLGKDDDFKVYKKGDKSLKKYLEAEKAKSDQKSQEKYDEIVVHSVDEDTGNRYLVCERCGGWYKLAEDESPEDFERCQCGGELYYETFDDEPDEKEAVKPEKHDDKSPNYTLKNIEKAIQETDGTAAPKTEGNIKSESTESLEKWIEEILSPKLKRCIPYDMISTFLFAGLCFLFLSISPLEELHIGMTLTTILMVFFPGYAITVIIYPRRDEINLWERLGLSVMLSLLVTLMFAVVSHYKGTSTTSLFVMVSIITMVLALMAIFSAARLVEDDSFYGYLAELFGKLKASTWERGDLTGKMSVVLIILLVLSIVTTVYLIANPNPGESFTEFYILGPQGKAADYPTNITAGKNQSVIIGLVNHEHKTTDYTMVVQSNGINMTTQNITLQANQKLEMPYTFKLQKTGKKEVEFLLYKLPDTQKVYLSLHLWVNVK
jgi:uncharacterized membrane protein